MMINDKNILATLKKEELTRKSQIEKGAAVYYLGSRLYDS